MSHLSKIFEEAPVKVQNKNGFDLSHLNVGSAKTGQLVPVMCKLLPPNTDFTLGVNMEVSLPPLATAPFGRIDAIVEGFVVPCSILYGGWKQFISNQQATMFPNSQSAVAASGFALPRVELGQLQGLGSFSSDYVKNDNIFEYLGTRIETGTSLSSGDFYMSLLPPLAYHLIWDVYYRNKQITKTIFSVNPNYNGTGYNDRNVSLIWHSFYSFQSASYSPIFSQLAHLQFPDGVPVWRTRQRNYARDYFTAATPSPQQGVASRLTFETAAEGDDSSFTIASLRAANALQKFLETNNLSGDYSDMMRNRWGTRPIDADFDEPYYLGRVVVPVYQKSVYQQDNSAKADAVNPFAKQGATATKGASAGFSGEGSICGKFHNTTWSFVMCLFSLVPHAMYGSGINRELTMCDLGDFPAPELQTVGNEAIYSWELMPDPVSSTDPEAAVTFGYIPRYSRFKYMDDEVHGELRPEKTLESFVLQRRFAEVPQLSSSFLEIPQDALDSVFAVTTANMNLSCWYEIFFEFKVSMPLADFCIPTLGDIQDTHTIKTSVGGSRL